MLLMGLTVCLHHRAVHHRALCLPLHAHGGVLAHVHHRAVHHAPVLLVHLPPLVHQLLDDRRHRVHTRLAAGLPHRVEFLLELAVELLRLLVRLLHVLRHRLAVLTHLLGRLRVCGLVVMLSVLRLLLLCSRQEEAD
jgi:hypothetical protein